MKRWKIIGSMLFIIGIFTTYYVQAMNELRAFPSFALETTEGNVEVLDDLELYGDYILDGVYHPFSLTLEETKYVEQTPYVEGLSGFYQSAEIKRLQQQYPSYMRGKETIQSMYTESDVYIVQAGMEWGTYANHGSSGDAFELSVLHKELDKQVRFTIPVPEADQSSFMRLEKTYAVGERLHLVTSHVQEGVSGDQLFELRIYMVELDRGIISRMDVVHTWEYDGTQEADVTPVENTHSILSDQRMLLLTRVIDEHVELADYLQIDEQHEGNIHYELLAYDFRTKGVETYPLPNEVVDGAQIISYEENSTVYASQIVEDELQLVTWKLGEEDLIETTIAPIERLAPTYTVSKIDDHMYVYVGGHSRSDQVGELHVFHVPSAEWIYRGEITIDRPLQSGEQVIIQVID